MDAKSLYDVLIDCMSEKDVLEVLEKMGLSLPVRRVTVRFTYVVEREFDLAYGDPCYGEDECGIVDALEVETGLLLDYDFEFAGGVVTNEERIWE